MQKQPTAQVTLSLDARNTLFEDVYRRQHIEACGVLLGHIDDCGNWHIEQARPLSNLSDSPVHFEFAAEDLLAVELDYPGQIVGVYHSHPTGLAAASSTDRENMKRVNIEQHIPWVWVIICGPFHETLQPGQNPPVIAYYYDDTWGLEKIRIEFEGTEPSNRQEDT